MPLHRPHLSSLLGYGVVSPSDDRISDYGNLDHAGDNQRTLNELQSDIVTLEGSEIAYPKEPRSNHNSLKGSKIAHPDDSCSNHNNHEGSEVAHLEGLCDGHNNLEGFDSEHESFAGQHTSDEKAEDEEDDESEMHKFLTSNPSCERSFEYNSPLQLHDDKHIRLLTLQPGKNYDEIHCEIAEYPLDDTVPEYETISYFWGGKISKSSIALSERIFPSNKIRKSKVLRLPRNLKLALKYLRHENNPRVLWADAICVNQDDRDEKTQQVGMLLDIYRSASRVVVWLGPEPGPGANKAFELCKHIVANEGKVELGRGFHLRTSRNEMERKNKIYDDAMKETYQSRKPCVTTDAGQKVDQVERTKRSALYRLASHDVPTLRTKQIQSLLDLLRRNWFRRIWVLQEVAVAPRATVQCGKETIDWQKLAIGSIVVRRTAEHSGFMRVLANRDLISVTEIANLRGRVQRQLDNPDDAQDLGILSLVRKYRHWHASQAEDKIYAIMGLSTTKLEKYGFYVDYNRSVEETYKKFAKAVLRDTLSLELFLNPKGDPEDDKDPKSNGEDCTNLNVDARSNLKTKSKRLPLRLPSWIPDWSDTNFHPDIGHRSFRATKDSQMPDEPRISESDSIHMKGSVVDHIKELSDCFENPSLANLQPTSDLPEIKSEKLHFIECLKATVSTVNVLSAWEKFARVDEQEVTYPTPERQHNYYVLRQTLNLGAGQSKGSDTPLNQQSASQRYRQFYKSLSESSDVLSETDIREVTKQMQDTDSARDLFDSSLILKLWSRDKKALYKICRVVMYGGFYDWDVSFNTDLPRAASLEKLHRRRLARTTSGLLALVPKDTRIGDQVVLLVGGAVPYIVRPKETLWELVGTAYIHGIMNGERWNESSCFPMEFT